MYIQAEKRFYGEGVDDFRIYAKKTVWRHIIEGTIYWNMYQEYVDSGKEVIDIPYVAPTPITFSQLKLNKLSEI